jgi:hypothetical protein
LPAAFSVPDSRWPPSMTKASISPWVMTEAEIEVG